jgi:FkbM family methyltransferase
VKSGYSKGFQNGQTVPAPLRCPRRNLGGRAVVDLGLKTGVETLAACELNATVYAFEPLWKHVADVEAGLKKRFGDAAVSVLRLEAPEELHVLDSSLAAEGTTPPGEAEAQVRLREASERQPAAFAPSQLQAAERRMQAARREKICHVTLVQAAAGAVPGWAQMRVNSGWGASLVDRFNNRAGDATRVVPVVRVDAIVPSEGLDVFLYKVDVQGYELEVLKGAEKLFASPGRVRQVWSEVWETGLIKAGATPEAYLSALADKGFACFETEARSQVLAGSKRGCADNASHFDAYGVEASDAATALAFRNACGANPSHWHHFFDVLCVNVRHAT